MAEYLTDHIKTPMYVMNSAFDVYQVQHILNVGCVPGKCSSAQIAEMVGYRNEFISSSLAHLQARASVGHGAYIDSCLVHEQNVDYCSGGNPHAYNCAGWLNTKVAGLTPQAAYSAWYAGTAKVNITVDPVDALAPAAGANPSCPWHFNGARPLAEQLPTPPSLMNVTGQLKSDDDTAAGCSSDLNCSLNGVCTSGSCKCDKPWYGPDCSLMMFLPVSFPQGYGQAPNLTTWGGGALFDNATQKYHSFISSMTNGCSLNHWGSNSRIEHGISDSVTGPYKFVDVAIPTWSHNAAPIALHDGTFAIVHIGSGSGAVNGGANCTCMQQGKGWPEPPAGCPPPPPPPGPPQACPSGSRVPGYHCYSGRCAAAGPCAGTHCDCGPDLAEPKLACKGEACAAAAAAACNAKKGCAQFTLRGENTKLYSNKSQLVANADWTAYVKVGSEAEQALHGQNEAVLSDGGGGSSIHVSKALSGPWLPLSSNTLGGCNNPAPWVHPNGTIFIVCGGSMKRAESIAGPCEPASYPKPCGIDQSISVETWTLSQG